ncbi:MAG: tRNA lysidine(34) synthetase TilS [Alphaproteobacteria bacterium]|nr:MAG: tRNA lysidine(34) synthetase TilS [Alphaproteobacteria bacterium]
METASRLTQADFSDLLQGMALEKGTALAVAVSGGADSLALTLLLGSWCRSQGIALTALTVDHGLRPAAAEEAQQVASWLSKYNIPHVTLTWQGDKPDSNIQDQARLARYRLMGKWCQDNGISRLFLGHHQGDQAETFLIRLFRGSGVDGLSAMKVRADFPVPLPGGASVTLCRPLLSVTKERLEASLRHLQQPWIEDPSNRNDAFTRIKVRKLLQDSDIDGLNPERLAQTAARMGRVQSLLQSLTAEVITASVTYFPHGYAEVWLEPLLAAHEEITLRALAQLTRRISGGKYAPRLKRLEALYDRLKQGDFAGQTLGGCLLSPLKENRLMISREIAAIEDEFTLEADKALLWDGRFLIEGLTAGGVVKKISQEQWRNVCQDHPVLKKMKLPKVVRDSLPCLVIDKGKVNLPDFMPGFEKKGFSALFR